MRSNRRRIDAGNRARERAFELIECRARLQRSRGINQIGHRLGLHQIDPAVEKRPQREFARLSRARPALDGRGTIARRMTGLPCALTSTTSSPVYERVREST